MVRRQLVVAALVVAALGCQRNLDMPPVPSADALSISPPFTTLAPREQVTFSGAGGSGAYSFAFAQGGKLSGADATIDPVSGVYQAGSNGSALDVVQVTDGSGSSATASIAVGARLAITPLSPSTTPGGRITFVATGGKQPYAYAFEAGGDLSGGDVSADGLYTAGAVGDCKDRVAVTDATGVTAVTAVNVGQALRIYRSETTAVDPLASVSLVAFGGKPPYSFSLQAAGSGTGAAINSVTGLYTAGGRPDPDTGVGTVTDVILVTDSAEVAQTATFSIEVGERARTISPSFAALAPREQVTFVAAGGSGGYTFAFATGGKLSGPDASIDPVTGAYRAGSDGSALDVVEVTDGVGRVATATISVGARAAIAPLSPSTTPGGRVTFSASGGKPPYTFAFEAAGNLSGGTVGVGGDYTAGAAGPVGDRVVVTDAAGATAVTTVAVGQALRIYRSDTSAVAPLASVTLVALGGKPPYTFSLQAAASGAGAAVDSTTGVYTAGARPLPDTGTGTVTDLVRVTDSADVAQVSTLSVQVGERQRTISPSFVALAPREQVTFTAAGGSGGYTYGFAPGGQASGTDATIDPDTGLYRAGSTGSALDVVQVIDGTGRSATATVSVGSRVALAPLSPSATPGGRVTFTASGGKAPYAYSFDAGGNLSGGTVGADGSYTAGGTGDCKDKIVVTDAAGGTAATTVNVGPALRVYRPDSTPVAPLASVTLIALGGKPPYSFSLAATASGAGAAIDGLSGVYTAGGRPLPDTGIDSVTDVVQVTDSADVPQISTHAILVGERPRTVSPSFVSLAPREQATFALTGGAGAVTWAFAPGGRVSGADATLDPATGLYRAGSDGSALDVVQATDAYGRTATATVSVGPRVAISPLSPSAAPGGRITFTASGGKPPYTFTLPPGGDPSGGSVTPGGIYTAGSGGGVTDRVQVSDAAGATSVTGVNVGAALQIYRSETGAVAPNESVTFIAFGGKPPYLFSLLSAASGAGAAIDPVSGLYTAGGRPAPDTGFLTVADVIQVTDASDVAQSATYTVTVGERLRLLDVAATEVHAGEAVQLVAAGGKPPYVFGFAERLDPAVGDPARVNGGNGGNRSGGSVEAATGIYRPGSSPGAVDFFQVADATGGAAAVNMGPPIGGWQLAIGNGTNGCTGVNVDADGSGDVAFFGRASSGGNDVAKITVASLVSTDAPELQPYYTYGWVNRVASYTVADFTGAGRDLILGLGGEYNGPTGYARRDIWALVPDLTGLLSLTQVLGGPSDPLDSSLGSGYLDTATGGWRFFATGRTTSGCPASSPFVDGTVIGFGWAKATAAPTAPTCYRVPNWCPFCSASSGGFGAATLAVGDFVGDANLDVAWILATDNNGQGASGANAKVSVAAGNGTTTFNAPATGWPAGYTYAGEWNEAGQPKFVVARAPAGAASVKDAVIVRLLDPTGRPKLFVVRSPSDAAAWTIGTAPNYGFDPEPSGAGVEGVIALSPNTVGSGTRSYFAAWSGTDGTVSGFALDWSTPLPTFVSGAPLASFPFSVTAACFSDVNTDGTVDLVAASDWGATAGIVLGDGTDSSAGSGAATFGGRAHQRGIEFPVTTGDLDGDGFGDAAVGMPGRGLAVMWGGGGQLAWGPTITSAAVGTATIGDFTGDGRRSVLYQQKAGGFGIVTFDGGGGDGFAPPLAIADVNSTNTGPAGSFILLWPADLGTSAAGGDAIGFMGGDGSSVSALLRQATRIVDVRAQAITPPANHGVRDCWPVAVGGGVPAVALACGFRLQSSGDPVDSVAIFGATLSNPNGAPGSPGQPTFGPWTQLSPPLVIGATAIWSPPGVANAAASSAGVVPGAAGGPGKAIFLVNTDRLYGVEVSGQLVAGNWTWNAPVAYPVGPTPVTGQPFLGILGRLDATSDFHVVTGDDGGMLVVKRTGGATPSYTLTQRLGVPLFPIGFGTLQSGSPGDVVGFMGNFDGLGVVPELVPLLNDGTGLLH